MCMRDYCSDVCGFGKEKCCLTLHIQRSKEWQNKIVQHILGHNIANKLVPDLQIIFSPGSGSSHAPVYELKYLSPS